MINNGVILLIGICCISIVSVLNVFIIVQLGDHLSWRNNRFHWHKWKYDKEIMECKKCGRMLKKHHLELDEYIVIRK